MTKNLKEEIEEWIAIESSNIAHENSESGEPELYNLIKAATSDSFEALYKKAIELFMQRARDKTVWDGESEHRVILLFDLEAIAKELD